MAVMAVHVGMTLIDGGRVAVDGGGGAGGAAVHS